VDSNRGSFEYNGLAKGVIALWLARQFLRNKDAARLELDGFGHGCQGIGINRDKGDMGLAAPVYPFVPT
jgi:hypothetical protein